MISKVNQDRARKLANPHLYWKIRPSWMEEAQRVNNLSFPLASLIEFYYVATITEEGQWSLWETTLVLDALEGMDNSNETLSPGKALIRAHDTARAKIDEMVANGELVEKNGSYSAPKN